MIRQRAAKAISTFSHPVIIFPASLPFFIAQTTLSLERFLFLIPILFILSIPIAFFLYELKKKKISDWDVTRRKERYPLYFISLICGGVALIFLYFYGNPILFTLALIFFILGFFIAVINFFWKISVHAAGVTVGALVFNLLLFQSPYLYLLIPVVAWSRREEKEHTWGQLIAGIVLATVVVFGVLRLRSQI